MRKIFTLLLFLLFINPVFAFEYSESDKVMFYNAFLDGYFTEMQKSINKLDVEQSKKDQLMQDLKKNTNRQELVNSSWGCIQKYPIQQIVSAAVICTTEWNGKQVSQNKELYDLLK